MKINLKVISLFLIIFLISISVSYAVDIENETLTEVNESTISNNNENPKNLETFNDLQKIIDRADEKSTIILENNYSFKEFPRLGGVSITKTLTIDGNGHTLDGEKSGRIFYISEQANNVVLKNIIFINGYQDGGAAAISVKGAGFTLDNCTFKNNFAYGQVGGAIYIANDDCTITNCNFINNTIEKSGGAFRSEGHNQIISFNRFINNTAQEGLGGALCAYGDNILITNNYFENNFAGNESGAVYLQGIDEIEKGKNQIISNNIFINNIAPIGGALSLYNVENFTISNNIMKKNYAYTIGGAIRVNGGRNTGKFIGNTIQDNRADQSGGAIYNFGNNTQVIQNIFINNTVTNYLAGTLHINGSNTIISNNVFDRSKSNTIAGAIFSEGDNTQIINNNITNSKAGTTAGAIYLTGENAKIINNLFENNSADNYSGALRINGNNAIIFQNKFIENMARQNGGATYLMGNNIQIINNMFFKNEAGKDNAGGAIWSTGNNINITQNNIHYNTADREGGGIWASGNNINITQNNIQHNTATHGGAISINGIDYTIEKNSINNNTAFENGGAIKTGTESNNGIITQNNIQHNTANERGGAAYIIGDAILTDNSFTNNRAPYGGALRIESKTNTKLENNVFTTNTATHGGAAYITGDTTLTNNQFITNKASIGGALRIESKTNTKLESNLFENNTATQGGAGYIVNTSTVTNNQFINNTATQGGAFRIDNAPNTIITNNKFFENEATYGGALRIDQSTNTQIENNQFNDNSAIEKGGAAYITTTTTLKNNIFIKNMGKHGGALRIELGDKTKIENNQFKENSATNGGASYIVSANNLIIDNSFVENTASDVGGALRIEGNDNTFSNNVFEKNLAQSKHGGGVSVVGDNIKLINNAFSNNFAYHDGGAIIIQGASSDGLGLKPYVSNNNFINNIASFGGAISLLAKDPTISYNFFQSNKAIIHEKNDNKIGVGGAFRITGLGSTSGLVANNTFLDNYVDTSGGAIYINDNNILIMENLFINSTARDGAGGAIYAVGSNTDILKNNITISKAGGLGGGIYLRGKDAELSDNTVAETYSKTNGGGMYLEEANNALLKNNNYHNTIADGMAGALLFKGSDSDITNNIFVQNIAKGSKGGGGSIYLVGNKIKLSENLFNNTESEITIGGAVRWTGDDGTITKNIFDNNIASSGYGIYGQGNNNKIESNTFISGKSTDATLRWSGSNNQLKNTFNGDYIIKAKTKINVGNQFFLPTESKMIIVKLKDETKKPIANRNLIFEINNEYYVAKTNENGIATVEVNLIDITSYNLKVTFNGDKNHESTIRSATITVTKQKTPEQYFTPIEDATLTINDVTYEYSATTKTATAKLTNDYGKSLPNKKITFTLDNMDYTAYTDANGIATLNFNLNKVNTYTVIAKFNGDDIYLPTTQTAKIHIVKIKTYLSVDKKTYVVTSSAKTVTATLKDEKGNVLANKEIQFIINGKTYTAKTNANGIATIKATLTAANTYSVSAKFNGDTEYESATVTGNIQITKEKTKITAPTKTFKKSAKTKKVVITLKSNSNKAIASKKITLKVNGKTYSAKTNKKGQATINVKLTAKKTYSYSVKFAGDSKYYSVTKTGKIKIK